MRHHISTEENLELEKRLAEHRKNPDDGVPWDSVRENLRRELLHLREPKYRGELEG